MNMAMLVGKYLESGVCDLYGHLTSREVVRGLPMYFHLDHSFMAATPDGLAMIDGEIVSGVDAKTSTYRRYDEFGMDEDKFGKERTDQLPIDYLLQGQQQCAVLGLEVVDFPVLFDGRTMRIYTVRRNEELIDAIIASESEMAERIINGDPPPPDYKHPNARKAISKVHGLVSGKSVQLNDDDAALWTEYQQLGSEIKERDERRREIAARIADVMGDCELGKLPAGQKEIRRVTVRDSIVTPEDVDILVSKLGSIKRKGYERLIERKVKS